MNFKQLTQDFHLVEPDKAPEKTASGIFIPEIAAPPPSSGTILVAGSGNQYYPVLYKAGDHVAFPKGSGQSYEVDGRQLLIIRESDMLGLLD
jgi:chaperonin GroES